MQILARGTLLFELGRARVSVLSHDRHHPERGGDSPRRRCGIDFQAAIDPNPPDRAEDPDGSVHGLCRPEHDLAGAQRQFFSISQKTGYPPARTDARQSDGQVDPGSKITQSPWPIRQTKNSRRETEFTAP